jgi:Fe-S cluster biogenesis protein NfuA
VGQPSVRELSERIDTLLDELGDRAMPAVMERVEELLQCVMALYGSGLDRIVEVVGGDALRALADDDVVGNLLVLHDLHPDDVDTRVQQALERVRPYLGSHAGGVSLSGVDEQGVVHLRLEGSCDGCPSSSLTVKSAIEDAILMVAPDVVAVEAEGMVDDAPALLQIQPFRPGGETGGRWERLDLDVPPRTIDRVAVSGETLVVANLDGTLVAYVDRCPACLGSLSAGTLTGDVLRCEGGHGYDARLAGRALDDGGAHLAPLPLLPEHGAWKVSLPRGAVA